MAKKKTTPTRRPIFAFVFWDELRAKCQAIADAEHGGNLTNYINSVLLSDVKSKAKKGK